MSDQSQSLPPSQFNPRQVRILKISIAIMTGLLVVGLIALFYGIARQASKIGAKPAEGAVASIVPPGQAYRQNLAIGNAEVKAILADRGAIIVHAKGVDGEEIITLDAQSGREIGRIHVGK